MASRFTSRHTIHRLTVVGAVLATGGVAWTVSRTGSQTRQSLTSHSMHTSIPPQFPTIKSREEHIEDLKRSSRGSTATQKQSLPSHNTRPDTPARFDDEVFDLLIIGGGATGTGIALDAATRGLKVALVEKDDFSSGTSSKSTKLVHGGVRYLEKAVRELDYEQYKLVRTALKERRYFLSIAPHLSSELPLLVPIRKLFDVPYVWAGTKLYDLLAGSAGLQKSYFMSRQKIAELFPMLDSDHMKGGIVYYDGQHNDSRMNISLAVTAALYGATVVNHMEVTGLEKDAAGKICGAKLRDLMPGNTAEGQAPDTPEIVVRARGVINATGPFADSIRDQDEGTQKNIMAPSSGVHVVLPEWVGPKNMGLVDPSSDGRVVFLLPWQGKMVAGTTDTACPVERDPIPAEQDVGWILNELNGLLEPEAALQKSDVLAAWSGIRPLVRDPHAKNTESLTRSHLITVSPSGLLTCVGGKWTTYREMAEDAVDAAIKTFSLQPHPRRVQPNISGTGTDREDHSFLDGSCQTHRVRLIGTHGYSKTLFRELVKRFGIESDVAEHLAHSYGDRAWEVAALSKGADSTCERLTPAFPYVDGEVRYAVRNEYARTAADVLARRTRLAFLDVRAALQALPTVIELMGEELNWGADRRQKEFQSTVLFLRSMGLSDEDFHSAGVE